MRLIQSRQINVAFVWCQSPITIDKQVEWGVGPGNFQSASNGAFLKMKSPTEVSHLVQPNEDKTAPVGWIPGDGPGLYTKLPIWVTGEILETGTVLLMKTFDGGLNYYAKEPSMVCYNGDASGHNLDDGWVQTLSDLYKNYEVHASRKLDSGDKPVSGQLNCEIVSNEEKHA